MSETDKVKEEIGFLKTVWQTVIGLLAAVTGWFLLYDKQDQTSGLALVAIVGLIAVWLFVQGKIQKLLNRLGEL